MLSAELDKANLPAIFAPNLLVLNFPAEYNQQYLVCSDSARLARIQDVLQRIAGKQWTLRCELAPQRMSPPANTAEPVEAPVQPLIERLVQVLDARVLRADVGFGTQSTGLEPSDSGETAPESEDE